MISLKIIKQRSFISVFTDIIFKIVPGNLFLKVININFL